MDKKFFLLLDTSFKSDFCYPNKVNKSIEDHFSKAMINIEHKLPGFEGDYKFIDVPFSFLEYVGGGQLISKLPESEKKALEKCFTSIQDLSSSIKETQEDEKRLKLVDNFLISTYNELVDFFLHEISPSCLILLTDEKLKKYKAHEHVRAIEDSVLEWQNCLMSGGRNSESFYLLCVHLAWNALIRYNWPSDQNLNNYLRKRLVAFYADPGQYEYNLPGSVLFSFLNGFKHFEEYGELLDPCLTDYACRGYFVKELNKWVPVVVVACDRRRQEERLKNYILGVKKVNAQLGKELINFVPGYLILIKESGELDDINVINITDRISEL